MNEPGETETPVKEKSPESTKSSGTPKPKYNKGLPDAVFDPSRTGILESAIASQGTKEPVEDEKIKVSSDFAKQSTWQADLDEQKAARDAKEAAAKEKVKASNPETLKTSIDHFASMPAEELGLKEK